jgi:hypothetical protein
MPLRDATNLTPHEDFKQRCKTIEQRALDIILRAEQLKQDAAEFLADYGEEPAVALRLVEGGEHDA